MIIKSSLLTLFSIKDDKFVKTSLLLFSNWASHVTLGSKTFNFIVMFFDSENWNKEWSPRNKINIFSFQEKKIYTKLPFDMHRYIFYSSSEYTERRLWVGNWGKTLLYSVTLCFVVASDFWCCTRKRNAAGKLTVV